MQDHTLSGTCDEFIEELGEKGLHVTKEEIDNFLERHNHKQN
jgi:hypothetical protein